MYTNILTKPLDELSILYPSIDIATLEIYKANLQTLDITLTNIDTEIKNTIAKNPLITREEITKNINRSFPPSPKYQSFIKQLAITKLCSYNQTEWINKDVSNGFYLLIPKNYYAQDIPELTTYISKKTLQTTEQPSKLELQLGLLFEHYNDIQELTLTSATLQNNKPAVLQLDTIFVTRPAYKQYKNQLPLWSFYINGHGTEPQPIDYWLLYAKNTRRRIIFNKFRKKI